MRHLWEWLLIERQVIVRSQGQIRYVPLSRIFQAGLGSLVLAGGGWFVYSTISYFDLRDTVFVQETVIARSEQAYRTLVQEMSNSRERVASLVRLLGETQGRVEGLAGKSAELKSELDRAAKHAARSPEALCADCLAADRERVRERCVVQLQGTGGCSAFLGPGERIDVVTSGCGRWGWNTCKRATRSIRRSGGWRKWNRVAHPRLVVTAP